MPRKIQLVHDWRHFKKWSSVRISAAAIVFMWAWDNIDKLRQYVPESWLPYIAIGLFIAVIVTRFINQGSNERNSANDTNNSSGS